jgi:hypothetical protein
VVNIPFLLIDLASYLSRPAVGCAGCRGGMAVQAHLQIGRGVEATGLQDHLDPSIDALHPPIGLGP